MIRKNDRTEFKLTSERIKDVIDFQRRAFLEVESERGTFELTLTSMDYAIKSIIKSITDDLLKEAVSPLSAIPVVHKETDLDRRILKRLWGPDK